MSSGLHVSLPSTSFTCNTCGIKFVAADLQREHMKTSWHRYNLKRRVAGLPLVTSEVFAHKVLYQEQLASLQNEVDEFGFEIPKAKTKAGKNAKGRGRLPVIEKLNNDNDTTRDESPAKSISSEFSQFSLGNLSQPHSEAEDTESNFDTGSELNYSEDIDDEELELNSEEEKLLETEDESDDDFIQVLPITYCFFCGENNKEIENNLKHMFNKHGLYIPERSYLVDLEGLLTFLSEIIYIDNECYVCGFESKNLEGIRQHVTSKGHCKVPYESLEEKETIEEFYDFSSRDSAELTTKSNKLVTFNEIPKSMSEVKSIENDRKTLPTGLEVGHREDLKYYHKPASSILKRNEGQKLLALADRRLSPGLTMRTVTKQEKLVRRFESKRKTKQLNHHKVARDNYHKHFFDPNSYATI